MKTFWVGAMKVLVAQGSAEQGLEQIRTATARGWLPAVKILQY